MSKLKLNGLADDTPVKVTAELPAQVYRDLVAYAAALKDEGVGEFEPGKLIVPMLQRFMATDRAFVRHRGRA